MCKNHICLNARINNTVTTFAHRDFGVIIHKVYWTLISWKASTFHCFSIVTRNTNQDKAQVNTRKHFRRKRFTIYTFLSCNHLRRYRNVYFCLSIKTFEATETSLGKFSMTCFIFEILKDEEKQKTLAIPHLGHLNSYSQNPTYRIYTLPVMSETCFLCYYSILDHRDKVFQNWW